MKRNQPTLLPDIPGNLTPTESETWIQTIRCGSLHPIPTSMIQMSEVWPQLQHLKNQRGCVLKLSHHWPYQGDLPQC